MDNIELERMLAASRASTSNVPISPQEGRNSLGVQYLMKSLSLGNGNPDMKEMNAYARDRARQGDADQLNSVLSGIAGQRHSQARDMYLKRALSAQNPIEVSGGMLTEDGFVKDPYAARERERKSNYEVGKELLDQETKAQDRRSAISPYYTPVSTAQGVRAFNSRTGQMELIKDSAGNTSVDYRSDYDLAGRISGARKGAELTEVQKQADIMAVGKQGAMDAQIELGFNQLASNPTGSGIGAGVDSAMGLFGKSTESSRTATALETTAGWLQNNVPRMEGPQSDRDTILYRQMAGQIGDRTVPVENRKLALTTLQTLMNKQSEIRQNRMARGEMPVYQSGSEPSSEGNAKPSAAPANSGFGEPPAGAVRKVEKQ